MAKLTVLSFGAGQDSTDLLYRYIYDEYFRAKYAPEDFIVINSDTGNEHKETYEHIKYVEQLCKEHDIEFMQLTKNKGYHLENWPSLKEFYNRTKTCGSKCFPKTCTDKLKLQPIYKFLDDYVGMVYGFDYGRKKALKSFADVHGKIDVLIGISKGEEKRMANPENETSVWRRKSINIVYPLIELGIDRAGCQESIKGFGHKVPLPSNCIICPFINDVELLWLYRFLPEDLFEWIQIEANKIEANKHVENNMGVWGNKLLPEKLEEVKEKYGHMTDDELMEYKMSHGHCVTSKY